MFVVAPVGVRRSLFAVIVLLVMAACWLVLLGSASADAKAKRPTRLGAQVAAGEAAQGARLVPALSTERSRTYRRSDGAYVARLFSQAVNFRDGGGRWRTIDSRLTRDGAGCRNGANRFALRFPASLASEPVVVRRGAAWVSFALRGAQGRATVAGNEATYRDALASTTVRLSAEPEGVKELLTLEDRRAPSRFVYDLKASPGLRAVARRGGGVDFVDRAGRRVLVLPASEMWPQDNPGRSRTLRETLTRSGRGWRLALSPARAWLARELARGPVVVDPTLQLPGATTDCVIRSDVPDSPSCNGGALDVGYNGTSDRRSLVRYDLSAVPRSAVVLNAAFSLTLRSRLNSTPKSIGLYRLVRGWNTSTTWNRADSATLWGSPGAGASSDSDATAAAVQTAGASNGVITWYPTKLVQGWVDGSQTNHGVLVRDVNPDTTANRLIFNSTEYGSGPPELSVVYEPRTGDLPGYGFDSHGLSQGLAAKVNLANGNLLVSQSDTQINGTGIDFGFVRSFNSLSGDDHGLGRGHTASIGRDVRLRAFADGSVGFYRGDGVALPFMRKDDGSFDPPAFLNASLVKNTDNSYTLTFNRTQAKLSFSSAGRLTAITDPNDNQLTLAYTTSGGLDSVTDTQGRMIDFTANNTTDNFVASLNDGSNHTWSYAYGGATGKQLTDVTNPANNTTHYDYDTSNRLEAITTTGGDYAKVTYDTQGRIATLFRATNSALTNGVTTSYSYDDPAARSFCALQPQSASTWNTVVTDANGHTTTFCFDRQDRVVQTKDADGRTRGSSYTPNGDVDVATGTATSGPAGNNTTFGYDTSSSLTSITQDTSTATGTTDELRTTMTYASTTPTGCQSTPGWLKHYPDAITDPQANTATRKYDCKGNLTSVQQGASGPKVELKNYDSRGNPATSVDPNLNETGYEYDTSGRLKKITPPTISPAPTSPAEQLGTTVLTYDSLSRVRTITDGEAQTQTIEYDALSRVREITYHDASTIAFAYDADGNLIDRDEVDGSVTKNTSYTYDKLQRLTREDLPGGGFNAYTYDNVGNLTSLQDQQGTVTYTHFDSNLLHTATFQVGSSDRTTTYSYDATGQRDTTILPNGVTADTNFDGAGRMIMLKATNASAVVHAHLTYSYAMPGTPPGAQTEQLRTQTDHVRGQTTAYTYDALNRVDVVTLKRNSDQFTLNSWDYAYDSASNITHVAGVYRLDGNSYNYATTYAYNQANQVCWHASGTTTPSCESPPQFANSWYHDANGNLIRTSDTSASTYNAKNQTLGLFGSNNFTFLGAGQDELTSYQAVQLQNNALGVGLVDSQRIIRDDQGGLIAARDTSSAYYVTDRLGSVIARSAQNGDLIEAYDYAPYGTDGPNTTSQPPSFGFAGGYRGPSSDAYHFGARFYRARHARWTQQDPINQASDLREANRYAYAAGDPVNFVDPLGTDVIGEIGRAAEAGYDAVTETARGAGKYLSRFGRGPAGRCAIGAAFYGGLGSFGGPKTAAAGAVIGCGLGLANRGF